ncbi:MAG: helix-turn-helix domain-containing protein [Candidatus Dormibacteraeota bacterium]|nr:helix-turn-helix domain-containing protein [Candidatus Dormibacteraeota bacterium]
MDSALQALSDQTRRRILARLHASRGAETTVDEVAATEGIHRTVAFTHLETLARAGLLTRGERPGQRGRPARTYRSAGAAEVSYPTRQHRLLASLLASAVREMGAADAAKRVGEAYGQQLASLDALGGEFEFDGDHIHARNCIFCEACEGAHEVVCGLQAGILGGVLGRHVLALGPDGSGGCLFISQSEGGA